MKKALSVLLLGCMMLALAACGGGSSSSSSSQAENSTASAGTEESVQGNIAKSDDIVIDLHAAIGVDEVIGKLVETYNEMDNGVTVNLHLTANDSYDDKARVLMAGSSDTFDAIWLRTPSQVMQYQANNALYNMADFIAASDVDMAPIQNLLKATTVDGGIYGMPTTGSAWLLYYNKTLFDELEMEYPINITWNEYADLVAELDQTSSEYRGGLIPTWTFNMGASSAGEYYDEPEPMPRTTEYMNILYRMYMEDKSIMGISEMLAGTFDANAAFGNGNVATMIMGDWSIQQEVLQNADFEWGIAPLPVLDGVEPGSTVGQSACFVISAKAPNPEAAYDFIEWAVTSDEGTVIWAEYMNVPSYGTDAAMAKYAEVMDVYGLEYRFSAKVNNEQLSYAWYQDVIEAFKEELELAMLGETTVEQAFENFYPLREEIIARYE